MSTTIYPKDFYKNRSAESAHAASKILAICTQYIELKSVSDVGCGTGTWLATALSMGAKSAHGFEGDWLTQDLLDDDRIQLETTDLENPFSGPDVDLVISLEVAEHLSPARANGFVEDLTKRAPAILFSAAIPGQGGVNHLNEQWQSYWAELFMQHNYQPYDIIRPTIWTDADIPAWYKQNTILYLNAAAASNTDLVPVTAPASLDKVHPLFWERANRELKHANARPESEYLKDDNNPDS